jgi:hypothetical protein
LLKLCFAASHGSSFQHYILPEKRGIPLTWGYTETWKQSQQEHILHKEMDQATFLIKY